MRMMMKMLISTAEKNPNFTFFEQGYIIIIIGNDVSLYFKSHLEVKSNMIMINAWLSQTLKSE